MAMHGRALRSQNRQGMAVIYPSGFAFLPKDRCACHLPELPIEDLADALSQVESVAEVGAELVGGDADLGH